MPHYITEKCENADCGICSGMCPVNAVFEDFYAGKNITAIDPETCIECGICRINCPSSAILSDEKLSDWAGINRTLAARRHTVTKQ